MALQIELNPDMKAKEKGTRSMRFSLVLPALAILLAPVAAVGQRGDPASIENRLRGLQQQLANLSAQIEQLRMQDQQLQQQLDGMRKRLEPRLERLEKGGARSRRR